MTNAEKYNDAIMAQMRKTGDWAIGKASGGIISCDIINCAVCKFYSRNTETKDNCIEKRRDWLNAEEKKEFSEKDKEVIRGLDKINWVAKDEDGQVYGYSNKPYKVSGIWVVSDGIFIKLANFSTAEFAAVKWEDDEPTSREEILGDDEK